MKRFRVREVGFGTKFSKGSGKRPDGEVQSDPDVLYDNEIAFDVGGKCYGIVEGDPADGGPAPCRDLVFDHHFVPRSGGGFPSAAAAILHSTAIIQERLGAEELVWLVTHRSPDFDAACAGFLVRALLEGTIAAEGWEEWGVHPAERIWPTAESTPPTPPAAPYPWLDREGPRPTHTQLPSDDATQQFLERWGRYAPALYLAEYACRQDHGLAPFGHRTCALHAILYAAQQVRRRNLGDLAVDFFRDASRAIQERRVHPVYDPLFLAEGKYAPELALLREEEARYHRDLQKARRKLVHVPKTNRPFEDWYTRGVARSPLIQGISGAVRPAPGHLSESEKDQTFVVVDGLFIRDPEAILFKEWAREDVEHSRLGQGFLFLVVAYSGQKPGRNNDQRYFISLHPEKCAGLHLYPVWARLTGEEFQHWWREQPPAVQQAYAKFVESGDTTPEPLFPQRHQYAGRRLWSNDPWYDGANYRCTILDTPNAGTALRPSQDPGLRGDEVAEITLQVLTQAIFSPICTGGTEPAESRRGCLLVEDFATSPTEAGGASEKGSSRDAVCFPELLERDWMEALKSGQFPAANLLPFEKVVERHLPEGCLRFAVILAEPGLDFTNRPALLEIAALVWPILEPAGISTCPEDLAANHYHLMGNLLILWNRRGLCALLGREPGGKLCPADWENLRRVREAAAQLARISCQLDQFLRPRDASDASRMPPQMLQQGRDLLLNLLELKARTRLPEMRPIAKMMGSFRFEELVATLHALHQQEVARQEKDRDETLEGFIRYVAVASVFLALVQSAADWGGVGGEGANPADKLRIIFLLALAAGLLTLPTVPLLRRLRAFQARLSQRLRKSRVDPAP